MSMPMHTLQLLHAHRRCHAGGVEVHVWFRTSNFATVQLAKVYFFKILYVERGRIALALPGIHHGMDLRAFLFFQKKF
jgi:hypothetical protein